VVQSRLAALLVSSGLVSTGLALGLGPALQAPAKPDVPANPAVTRAEIEAEVRFLASDELAGRSTGSPEGERAAAHLAEAFAKCGLEPAGDAGTFLQGVPLQRTEAKAAPELRFSAAAGAPFAAALGRDFEAPSVPVDVRDLDVVVAKSAAEVPKEADPKKAIFVDAFVMDAKRWLEDAGHPSGAGFGLWIQGGSKTAGEAKTFKPGPLASLSRDEAARASTPSVRVRGPLLERLRKKEFARVSLDAHVERVSVHASNVVGRIAGAGLPGKPELAREAVVVSAHYDHLPPGHEGAGGDTIFNGADDDASGCAAVLEIAGAMAAGKKPARTMIFLLATGEEEGLLGTEVYLDHPAVPLEQTVANLNVEMIGRPDPLVGGSGQLWLTGFDETDLGPTCAAKKLAVKPDPRPDQHFYERSDNYAFVVRKVVGQTFSTYNLHTDYHRPSDEANTLDYAHMESCTRTILEAVRLVADGEYKPAWAEAKRAKAR
jgi:hypothetical protein